MITFLEKHGVLTSCQHGFSTNDSTDLAVTSIYDKLLDNMSKNQYTCSIFLDLSKAFDTVDHKILLHKLYNSGFRGKIWNFLQSYLSGRRQCTKVGQNVSKLCQVSCGIPQGSVLGPLLFLVYVNDLPNASYFDTTLFADDTNLHLSNKNLNQLQIDVNNELKKIDYWMKINKLSINYSKINYMIICRNPTYVNNFSIVINGINIKRTNSIRYLGVIIDEKLCWDKHIFSICSKLSQVCGIIFKLRHYVPLNTLRIIYYALFYPKLQYSLINWGRTSNKFLNLISVHQIKFIRASLFCTNRSAINPMYTKFGVLQLKDVIKLEHAKFMYRYENNMLPCSFDNYFTKLENVHNHKTRYKMNNGFFLPRVKTNFGKKRTHFLCVKIWEEIPQETKSLSFYGFKKQFKKKLIKQYS